jgi:hypothetical protein
MTRESRKKKSRILSGGGLGVSPKPLVVSLSNQKVPQEWGI